MQIRLIGPVEADLGDDEVRRFSAPKLACVLASLAMTPGEPVNLTNLITNVWGDQPPETAVSVVYSYIARLRALFRNHDEFQIMRAGSNGYTLDTQAENVDVHAMRRKAARADELTQNGSLHEALPLWRESAELAHEEALVGIDGDWAAEIRTRFRAERIRLLTNRYGVELALGHHTAMVDDIAEAVAREPFAEPLIGHHMVALYRCGRAAEALERFETTRAALRDRLGADPSPALRDLHRRILNQDPALTVAARGTDTPTKPPRSVPVPAQLPFDTTGFVGRTEEINRIKTQSDDGKLVVIDGMAGVGKTALAVHVAHQLAPEYPDGQLYVDLRAYATEVAPLTPDQALAHLLRSLDQEVPHDSGERIAALRTALSGRRMLLLLDNADDTAQVVPLLPGGRDCLTIITSRRRLVGLVDARPISLGTLSAREAAQVFASEADIDTTEDSVDQIAEACGRLPLALRVAASRLRNRPNWTPADLLQRLIHPPTVLRELDAAGQGVVAAFDLSYRELDDDTARLFRLLSVFPAATFDSRIAATLADTTPAEAYRILERLLDDHLVIAEGADRYRLHDLVKKYAATRVTDPAEREAAKDRLIEWYIASAWHALGHVSPHSVNWARQIQPSDGRPAVVMATAQEAETWFQSELTVLEQLIHDTATLGMDARTVDLCMPVQGFLLRHGGATTGRSTMAELALAAASRLDDRVAQARLTNYIGSYYSDVGRWEDALARFQWAAELWASTGDQPGMIATLNNTASVAAEKGDHEQAAGLFVRAAEVARDAGLVLQEVHTRIGSVGPLRQLWRLDEAQEQLDAAEALLKVSELERQWPRLWFHQAIIQLYRGELETAANLADRVLRYARDNRVPDMLVSGLWAAAAVDLEAGRYAAALDTAHEALDRLQRSRLSIAEARALTQLGVAQAGLGDHPEAIASLRAAITAADDLGARAVKASAETHLAEQLVVTGNVSEATALLKAAEGFYAANETPELAQVRHRLMELS